MIIILKSSRFLSLLFLSLSALTSCQKTTETPNKGAVEIDLSTSREAKLSEFFQRIDYVLLDYSDDKPIVFPYKMAFEKDRFFVESRENASIFIFDWKGNVKEVIQRYGDGPGEFRLVDQLAVNDSILNVYAKHKNALLKFNLDGKLISETKVTLADDIHYGGDFHIYYYQHGEGVERNTFFRFSDDDSIGYLPADPNLAESYSSASVVGFIQDLTTRNIYFKEENSYLIHSFDSLGFYSRSINFDFGLNNYPLQKRVDFMRKGKAEQEYLRDHPVVARLSNFFVFRNRFFLAVNHSPRKRFWIFLDKEFNPTAIIDQFENDLDGSLIKMRTWTQTADQIVYQINSRQFFNDYVETFNDQEVEIKPGNIHDFFSKNREKLKEEKHVLVFLKMK